HGVMGWSSGVPCYGSATWTPSLRRAGRTPTVSRAPAAARRRPLARQRSKLQRVAPHGSAVATAETGGRVRREGHQGGGTVARGAGRGGEGVARHLRRPPTLAVEGGHTLQG